MGSTLKTCIRINQNTARQERPSQATNKVTGLYPISILQVLKKGSCVGLYQEPSFWHLLKGHWLFMWVNEKRKKHIQVFQEPPLFLSSQKNSFIKWRWYIQDKPKKAQRHKEVAWLGFPNYQKPTPLSCYPLPNRKQYKWPHGEFHSRSGKKYEPGLHILSPCARNLKKQTVKALHPNPGDALPEKKVDETPVHLLSLKKKKLYINWQYLIVSAGWLVILKKTGRFITKKSAVKYVDEPLRFNTWKENL